MTNDLNNSFEEANENILDNERETVYFNKQKFAEIIFNKIVYDVIEEDDAEARDVPAEFVAVTLKV